MSDKKNPDLEQSLRSAKASTPPTTKTCAVCGAEHDEAAWQNLHLVGVQLLPMPDGTVEQWELRDCAGCKNTLARILK